MMMDETQVVAGEVEWDEEPLSVWERIRRGLLKAFEGAERVVTTVTPCPRCGTEHTVRETWAATRQDRPFYALADYLDVLSLCPDCFELSREERALEAQRAEEARALLEQQAGYAREARRVQFHLDRAVGQRRLATLTIAQWMHILDRFHWRCAYCEDGPYEALEHVVPLVLGGGTTADNCVPACRMCNSLKASRHPASILKTAAGLQRVYQASTATQGFGNDQPMLGAPGWAHTPQQTTLAEPS